MPQRHHCQSVSVFIFSGCTEGWHGEVDILIKGKEIPLTVVDAADAEISDTDSVSSISTIEVKKDSKFSPCALQQVMAQTIVFSFLQHKENKDLKDGFLVPGIGICAEKLIVYMYDSKKDILLESLPIDIFSNDGPYVLHLRAVVVLWLLLNYGDFGTAVPKKFKDYTSEFHNVIGKELLDMYSYEVKKPCHVKPTEKFEHEPDWFGVVCPEDAINFFPENSLEEKCLPLLKK